MNSLGRSLQIGLVISLVVLMFVFWWSITLTSRMLIDSYVFQQLETLAYRVHSIDPDVRVSTNPQLQLLLTGYPQRSLAVQSDQGLAVVSGDSQLWQSDVPVLAPGEIARLSTEGPAEQSLRIWYGGFSREGDTIVLGAAQDVTGIVERLRVFHWFAAILGVMLLVVLLTVQRVVLARSARKLEGIRRDMLRLEYGQAVALSEDVPSEVMPLVVEFNQLLHRFEQRLRQSRNSVGNLAHSLKGPLNLLIRSSTSESIGKSEREVIAQNAEHIRRLIESELKRARLAGRGAVGIRFDVDAELPAMIGLLEQVYADKTVKVSYHVESNVELIHDRQDMLELFGNLLDNAVKWSRSNVVVTVRELDGVVIEVEDDGPGCSPELLDRLTGRGVRLDESVAGHGLGLSIVKDILDTYDGRLNLTTSSSLGGLKATAYLPHRR